MKLFEIDKALREIASAISENEGIIEPEQEKLLDNLECAKDEKISGCCAVIRELMHYYEAHLSEIERLKRGADRIDRNINWLKRYIGFSIGQGVKWTDGINILSWRSSVKVEVDEEHLPIQYWTEKVTRSPDKAQIKKDLECGASIPGARLEKSQNLQVK